MTQPFVSRGFTGKRRQGNTAERVPPGQHEVNDFPVLSAGPTPRTRLESWTFTIEGNALKGESARWTWNEIMRLPQQEFVVDIHCVTKWTKLDTRWRGVSVDVLFEHIVMNPNARYVIAYSDGGYTTNIPIPDLINGQAFIAHTYDAQPLAPEHGGPMRLVVPHLYFWKSAKWVRGLRVVERDEPGFWESLGYHNHGDPFKEERYSGD